MKITIDRIEGGFAVVELPDRRMIDVPLDIFPEIKEGDIVEVRVDAEETRERKKRIEELMDELWEN